MSRFLSGILLFLWPITASAMTSYSVFDASLDEINCHQSVGFVSQYFGEHGFLAPGEHAVAGHLAVGSYGYEAFFAGVGLSVQSAALLPVTVGLSYSGLDAEFETHTWALDVKRSLAGSAGGWLLAQAVIAHQVETAGSRSRARAFQEFGYGSSPHLPDNPEILVEDVTWNYGYLQLTARRRLGVFRPTISFGLLLAHHSYRGKECDVGGCWNLGSDYSNSGTTTRFTSGIGMGLDLNRIRPFVGISSVDGEGQLLARLAVFF